MKYQLYMQDKIPLVVWAGFGIPVNNENGAAKLVEELNNLDRERVRTRQELEAVKRDLTLQIEAKNNYISLAASFVTAIRESQKILANYLEPGPKLNPHQKLSCLTQVVNDILDVLDNRDLVTLVQGSSLSEKDIRPSTVQVEMSTLNDWENATHQITFDGGKHWTNVELDGDCFTACSDGKRSWSVDSIVPANVVARPGDPLKSIVDAAEMGTTIHEILNRLTKVISETQLAPMITTNHFAPKPKASKKQLAALEEVIDYLEDEHPAPDTINRQLRKLLKKLS